MIYVFVLLLLPYVFAVGLGVRELIQPFFFFFLFLEFFLSDPLLFFPNVLNHSLAFFDV